MVDWRTQGVLIVKSRELDFNTPLRLGMTRAAAMATMPRPGPVEAWAGTVSVAPNAKSGAHHHWHPAESIIYVVKRLGANALGGAAGVHGRGGPGGLHLLRRCYVPHQEINALPGDPLECVVVRSDQEAVVVNLDIAPAEEVEEVRWVDPNHPEGPA